MERAIERVCQRLGQEAPTIIPLCGRFDHYPAYPGDPLRHGSIGVTWCQPRSATHPWRTARRAGHTLAARYRAYPAVGRLLDASLFVPSEGPTELGHRPGGSGADTVQSGAPTAAPLSGASVPIVLAPPLPSSAANAQRLAPPLDL